MLYGPGPSGVRRVRALYDGLPASARTHLVEHGGWSITDHLLARMIEETDKVARTVFWSVPRKQGTRGPEPVRIDRPGAKPKPRLVSPRDFMRMARTVSDG